MRMSPGLSRDGAQQRPPQPQCREEVAEHRHSRRRQAGRSMGVIGTPGSEQRPRTRLQATQDTREGLEALDSALVRAGGGGAQRGGVNAGGGRQRRGWRRSRARSALPAPHRPPARAQ
jgi:hypothetical protein